MSEFEDKLQSILGNSEAMGQIMSIAQSLTGGSDGSDASTQEEPDAPPSAEPPAGDALSMLGNLDPRLVQMGMRLLSEYNNSDDRKVALLTALQPFIREERYAKVDKAIQVAKLAHVIRVALDTFRKGDGDDV